MMTCNFCKKRIDDRMNAFNVQPLEIDTDDYYYFTYYEKVKPYWYDVHICDECIKKTLEKTGGETKW